MPCADQCYQKTIKQSKSHGASLCAVGVGDRGRALSGRESRENHAIRRTLSRDLKEVREPAMSLLGGKVAGAKPGKTGHDGRGQV